MELKGLRHLTQRPMTAVFKYLKWKRVLALFFVAMEGRTTIIVMIHQCGALIEWILYTRAWLYIIKCSLINLYYKLLRPLLMVIQLAIQRVRIRSFISPTPKSRLAISAHCHIVI